MPGSGHYAGLTSGAQRTVARCRRIAAASAEGDPWAAYLVLALLDDESLAAACLLRLGINRQWLMNGELGGEVARLAAMEVDTDDSIYHGDSCQTAAADDDAINDPLDFTRVLDRAAEIARRGLNDSGVTSANLLLAIVEINDTIRERFSAAGATPQRILAELYPEQSSPPPPLRVDDVLVFSSNVEIAVEAIGSSDTERPAPTRDVWRVIDANLNRAREGLRVLEDFARFLSNDEQASLELKALRHELVAAERLLMQSSRESMTLAHRDTVSDVGTSLSTQGERIRGSLADVVVSNCRRVQESLRSLEEFGKLLSGEFASVIKQLRYRTYTAEKSLRTIVTMAQNPDLATADGTSPTAHRDDRLSRLQRASVYVLITESLCRLPWRTVVEECLVGGADVLQLREKSLNDRELLRRSQWLRDACRSSDALFIVNDRADLAVASLADGVHVGQDELPVNDARRTLQPGQLVGLSTHNIAQATQAVPDGADYLGIGPVFPSRTKTFESYPGLTFVRAAASSVSAPWFAIGGVTSETLNDLMEAGATRVAVTSAVISSDEPQRVVREFKARLMDAKPGSA